MALFVCVLFCFVLFLKAFLFCSTTLTKFQRVTQCSTFISPFNLTKTISLASPYSVVYNGLFWYQKPGNLFHNTVEECNAKQNETGKKRRPVKLS